MRGLEAGFELGRYVIEDELGRGGMGVVYSAREVGLGRRVALKVIAPELADDAAYTARFQRESRLAASVEHPNVVPVYEAGEDDGLLFIAMRFVPGEDLRAIVQREGLFDPRRAIDILEQIAAGLDAVHVAGLVHRDVKPANVLVTVPDQSAYLTDFGLARQAAGESTGMSNSQVVMGTADYMSPEQFLGGQVDARSDIYSLTALLYHLLEGRPPFGGRDPAAKGYAHVHESPPRLRARAPAELDDVVRRGMAKDPTARYSSAGDLAIAARAGLEGLTARLRERTVATGEAAPFAQHTGATRPLQRGAPRGRTVVALGVAAVAVGAVVGTVIALSGGAGKRPAPSVAALTATPRDGAVAPTTAAAPAARGESPSAPRSPAFVTIGRRAAFSVIGLPPSGRFQALVQPLTSIGGNCCGRLVARGIADQQGAAHFSMRFPATYANCSGYLACVNQPWARGEQASLQACPLTRHGHCTEHQIFPVDPRPGQPARLNACVAPVSERSALAIDSPAGIGARSMPCDFARQLAARYAAGCRAKARKGFSCELRPARGAPFLCSAKQIHLAGPPLELWQTTCRDVDAAEARFSVYVPR